MTKQKDLKRRIRERMLKTGESYTTARLHLLRSGPDRSPGQPTARRLRLPRTGRPAVHPSRLNYAAPVFTILLFILVALTGCVGDMGAGSVAVSDSAGIRIVDNLPGSIEAAEVWTLSADPVVAIGSGIDPAIPLFHVTDIAPLDDGSVAVATNTPPQGRVFDSDGTLLATLGRQGSGPGEFTSVASIVPFAGDSVAVWDADRRRISVFERSGRFAREIDARDVAPLSARAAVSDRVASGFIHLLASGQEAFIIFGEGALSPGAAPGIARPSLPAVRISTTGDALAEYGPVPGMEMVHGGAAGALPLPFGARTSAATAGEMLIIGTGESTQFDVVGADGELARIVRWPDHERATGGDWLEEWTAMVEAAPSPIRELVEAMPRRTHFPAYDYVITSDEGAVMVGEYAGPVGIWPLRRPDEGPEALRPVRRPRERRWLVFDPDGVLFAMLRTPEGFAPAAVREGRIWGVFTDTLDIESVRAYRILR